MKERICSICGEPIPEEELYKIIFSQGVIPPDWKELEICGRCVSKIKTDLTITK